MRYCLAGLLLLAMSAGAIAQSKATPAAPAALERPLAERSVGDWLQRVSIVPTLRPELTSVVAEPTSQVTLQLVAILGGTLAYERAVEIGVLIHGSMTVSGSP